MQKSFSLLIGSRPSKSVNPFYNEELFIPVVTSKKAKQSTRRNDSIHIEDRTKLCPTEKVTSGSARGRCTYSKHSRYDCMVSIE